MSNIFTASRIFGGSLLFPATIEVTPTGVRYAKPALIGGREELINFQHIASVRLSQGLFHTTLAIETSGGSAPILIAGLRSADAKAIRDDIERAQTRR